jgi:DNA-binding transcriptional regulator YiaG
MTKTVKSRIARLEETHQRKVRANDRSFEEDSAAAIEKVQQYLSEQGIQQSPEESLAETFARALGISTDELKKWLMELEHGFAALRRREARGEA